MKTFMCVLACLLLFACGSDETGDVETTTQTATQTIQKASDVTTGNLTVELATRNVSCGCALEEIGHCGNYIEIDSRYVEIANGKELGLGVMEWCGQSGVQAESAGALKDGKFVAATLVIK